jgi:hypothetical protein
MKRCVYISTLAISIATSSYLIPTCDDVITHFHGKRIFIVIDMKDSYWQVALDKPSSLLCTFNSPFGLYSFRRLPFGISCAPEVLQSGTCSCSVTFPVYTSSSMTSLRLQTTKLSMMRQCKLSWSAQESTTCVSKRTSCSTKVFQVKYVRHIVLAQVLSLDPDKVQVTVKMPTPTCADLSRFTGIGNWLYKLFQTSRQ